MLRMIAIPETLFVDLVEYLRLCVDSGEEYPETLLEDLNNYAECTAAIVRNSDGTFDTYLEKNDGI